MQGFGNSRSGDHKSVSADTHKRIVFTGGSGTAGRHVIAKLLEYVHEILNVDLKPLDNPSVHTLKADLTDGAQAYKVCHATFESQNHFPGL
jgi:nucleoside-diphosphate-sugar epimerase